MIVAHLISIQSYGNKKSCAFPFGHTFFAKGHYLKKNKGIRGYIYKYPNYKIPYKQLIANAFLIKIIFILKIVNRSWLYALTYYLFHSVTTFSVAGKLCLVCLGYLWAKPIPLEARSDRLLGKYTHNCYNTKRNIFYCYTGL